MNTFHFLFGEMTITLFDFAMLASLEVSRDLVVYHGDFYLQGDPFFQFFGLPGFPWVRLSHKLLNSFIAGIELGSFSSFFFVILWIKLQ